MFLIIFLLLGLGFGYALGWPWSLLAFVIPLLLLLGASNRSGSSVVIGFAAVAIGLLAGIALRRRVGEVDA